MTVRRIVVVGGGITGLSAAWRLLRRAETQGRAIEVTVLEADARPGGKIITERTQDFVLEGGPDSFVTDKPWCLSLCRELGLEDQLIPCNTSQAKVYMLYRGKLVPFPAGFRLTIPTKFWPFVTTPLLSSWGKVRMAMEVLLPPRPADRDETLAAFIGRRLGREAVERIAGPMMAGIFVSDPDRMSMRGTFPTFLEMERKHGGLIRAAWAAKRAGPPPGGAPSAGRALFNSLRGGMGTLVDVLAERLGPRVRTGSRVEGITRDGAGYTLEVAGPGGFERLSFDDVLLAVPASAAARLLAPLDAELSAGLSAIRFVSTATVSLGYLADDLPEDRPLDGFGVLIPPGEKSRLIACTWVSTKFKHRAPSGCVLLRGFFGGYRDEAGAELDAAALEALARDEFAGLFGIKAPPVVVRVARWPKGNPQYDVGHLDRVAALERRVAASLPGLHLAGSSYHGIGMPDCIKSAEAAVARMLPES
jgi:oxygen-dependent protoporphyrinogen oxidase